MNKFVIRERTKTIPVNNAIREPMSPSFKHHMQSRSRVVFSVLLLVVIMITEETISDVLFIALVLAMLK